MKYYLAIDIGASSGRHILGHVEDGKLLLEEIYRFDNGYIEKNGHFYWDTDSLFCKHLVGGSLAFGMRNTWYVQASASSLNCPAILVLEFLSIENESPIALSWGAHLPPASNLTSWAAAS